jgi:cytochrome P450
MTESLLQRAGEIGGAARRPRPAPGPRGHRLLGNLLEIRRDRLRFVRRATARWGDLVAFRMGPRQLYLLNHPDHFRHVLCESPGSYVKGLGLTEARPLLGDGLLTSDGDLWASQRGLLQRAFRRTRLDGYAQAIVERADQVSTRWARYRGTGTTVDAAGEMLRLTLEILGATLLPGDLGAYAGAITADMDRVAHAAMRRMTAVVRLPLSLPTPANLRLRRAVARLELRAEELLDHARPRAAGRQDLLSLLLAPPDGLPAVSSRQVRDEVLTFLLAGHETTAATLAWTWYLLARHPHVERRLHAELDAVLGERLPTLEELPALTYTRAVLEEVLRLYPPVWLIPRKAVADDVVGGYAIPAGAEVLLSVYTLHRHSQYWPEPDRFAPERFLGVAPGSRHPFAYLPFGAGARSCLGSHFGLMEATLVVAVLARRYRLRLPAGSEATPEASLTLKPAGGLAMRPVARG